MDRDGKLKLNTAAAVLNQIVTILSGFILPRFYLKTYGSTVFGLVTSISQFLGFVTLMELGMGAVVQSSLYDPLAKRDYAQISRVISSAERFFRIVASVFFVYTLFLAVIYPLFIQREFDWWFEASLILILSLSTLSEYYFGITYKLLLTSDQLGFIPLFLQTGSIVLVFGISILLMKNGAPIQIVKLTSVIVVLIRPIGQFVFVKKNYRIDKQIIVKEEPIKQKWNGIAQHVAYYVTNNTDIIVLTVFSSLANVSVYSVYNMVANGIKQLILTLSTGNQALFGNLFANDEQSELKRRFIHFEWQVHVIVTILFTCVALLIVPFIQIYTYGVNDADYYQPAFAIVLTIATAAYCIRLPYNIMVCAAGHYKQTQFSAIMEMVINLGVTIALVFMFGLLGVALGTLVALSYRTLYLVYYLSRSIIYHRFAHFVKNIIIDAFTIIMSVIICKMLDFGVANYYEWFFLAIKVFMIVFASSLFINLAFARKRLELQIKQLMR